MLTIFSCPKPFKNNTAILQKNAIFSWTLLDSKLNKPEIILVGDEEGTKEICDNLGLKYLPDIKKNKSGVPFLSSIFTEAEKIARYDLLCFINTDIILLPEFCSVIQETVKKLSDKFLLTGQRINTDINYPLNFEKDWDKKIKNTIKNKNWRYAGPDYFIFLKGTYKNIPSFAIGRYFWDNWLIYQAIKMKISVVDLTSKVFALHQKHNYIFTKKWHLLETLLENDEVRYNFKISKFAVAYDTNNFPYKLLNGNIIKNKPSLLRPLVRLIKYFKYKFYYLAGEYKIFKPIAKLFLFIRYKIKK